MEHRNWTIENSAYPMTGTQIDSHPMRFHCSSLWHSQGFSSTQHAFHSSYQKDSSIQSSSFHTEERFASQGMRVGWLKPRILLLANLSSPTRGRVECSLLRLLIPRLRSLVSHPREPIEHVFEWIHTHTERESRWTG